MFLQSRWEAKISPVLSQWVQQRQPDELAPVIIEVTKWGRNQVSSLIQAKQGKVIGELDLVPSVAVLLPTGVIPELAQMQAVIRIWEDSLVQILPQRPLTETEVRLIGCPGYTGKEVVVAVLDTGIYPHEDLTLPENRILAWYDQVQGQICPYDDHGHGTFTAGIIAGNGRASRGKYSGLAPEAKLVGVKVLDQNGRGKLSDLILGIEWCLNNQKTLKIRIINLSLGTCAQGEYYQDLLCRVTTLATKKGVVVCTAVGCGIPDWQRFNSPGINPSVIKAGLINQQQVFTNEDERLIINGVKLRKRKVVIPDLVIPEVKLGSLKAGAGYSFQTGPSLAASLIAGGAALILQKWPRSRPVQVKRILTRNADDLGLGNPLQGAGRLNLARALAQPGRINPGKARGNRLVGNSGVITAELLMSETASEGVSGTGFYNNLVNFGAKRVIGHRYQDSPPKAGQANQDGGLFAPAVTGPGPNQLMLKELLTLLLQNYEELLASTGNSAQDSPGSTPFHLLIKSGINLLTRSSTDPGEVWSDLVQVLLSFLKGLEFSKKLIPQEYNSTKINASES